VNLWEKSKNYIKTLFRTAKIGCILCYYLSAYYVCYWWCCLQAKDDETIEDYPILTYLIEKQEKLLIDNIDVIMRWV
jgi:hypothetical protein